MPRRNANPPVRTDKRLPPPLIESPAFVLMQAGKIAYEWVADALAPYELSVVQFAALLVAQRLGPACQAWLAERLAASEPEVALIVSELERDGLVKRFADPLDRRKRLVSITAAGRELVAEASDEVAGVEAENLDDFSEELHEGLAKLPPEQPFLAFGLYWG